MPDDYNKPLAAMLALTALLVTTAAQAQVNKCEVNGQMTWQSDPCPPGTALEGSEEAQGSEGRPAAAARDPIYDLAYRTAQAIERTYLSYQRCQREEVGGCQKFIDRYIEDLGTMLREAEAKRMQLAQNPAATALLRRHQADLNEMTTFLKAATELTERARALER